MKHRKQKLYMVFVDFRNYFDCINRNSLFYKLQKCGITGNVYDIIKSAYTNNMYRIKTKFGITVSFMSTSGVKQGCNLSPTLSNIYQNDIHDIFSTGCDPVELDGILFNSLSWADDLVIMSTSKTGLQKCLNNLSEYCEKWQLSVNIQKTKVMVLSGGNAQARDIKFEDIELECVSSYKYLGLIFSRNGNITKMEEDRIEKAQKASFVIRQAISTSQNVSVNLALSLFDKQIEPILLYGCPI